MYLQAQQKKHKPILFEWSSQICAKYNQHCSLIWVFNTKQFEKKQEELVGVAVQGVGV